jgi:hypothetical protein
MRRRALLPPLPVLRERSASQGRERAAPNKATHALWILVPHAGPNSYSRAERNGQPQKLSDGNCDGLNVLQHILIRESKNLPALLFEESLPGYVIGVLVVVISAINFDNEFLFDAREVGKEWFHWELPTKFQSAQAFGPHDVPE